MAGSRVLIVEDNQPLCKVLDLVLTKKGFDIRLAYEWKSAMSLMEKETFDAMVLDVMLPGMSGYDILESLRRGEYADLPVVVSSALGSDKDEQRAIDAGATAVCPKPFSPNALALLLQELIDKRKRS